MKFKIKLEVEIDNNMLLEMVNEEYALDYKKIEDIPNDLCIKRFRESSVLEGALDEICCCYEVFDRNNNVNITIIKE